MEPAPGGNHFIHKSHERHNKHLGCIEAYQGYHNDGTHGINNFHWITLLKMRKRQTHPVRLARHYDVS